MFAFNRKWYWLFFKTLFLALIAFTAIEPVQASIARQKESQSAGYLKGMPAEQSIEQVSALQPVEIIFFNGTVQLGGSLHLPPGAGPFPAVVMIHGSELATREIFWESGDAQAFLDAGLAVFLYDKRGTGNSGGDGDQASLDDLAGDALAAVRITQQQAGVIPEAVGVFGVSQGGWLGPLVASLSDEVAFVINVTGATVPLANQEMWGVGNELAARGFTNRDLAFTMKSMHLLFSARTLLQKLGMSFWFVHKDPYLDPADFWPEVRQPIFAAYGALDRVVPTASSAAIAGPILQAGHPYNRLYIYPDAGHGIRSADGNWAEGHIHTMTAWALSVAAGRAPETNAPVDSAAFDIGSTGTGANHWYGSGAQPSPWYSTAIVQLPLLLFFTFVFLAALLTSLNPFARQRIAGYRFLSRLALGFSAAVNLLLLAGFVTAINFLLNADAEGYYPPVPMSGWLPGLSLMSLALSVGLLFFTRKAGREPGWSRWMKSIYRLVSIASVGFGFFLVYWGMVKF